MSLIRLVSTSKNVWTFTSTLHITLRDVVIRHMSKVVCVNQNRTDQLNGNGVTVSFPPAMSGESLVTSGTTRRRVGEGGDAPMWRAAADILNNQSPDS
jgi:hypothetical protein